MTYHQLLQAICNLSIIDLQKEAVVWPPEGCPNASDVPVTELRIELHKSNQTNVVRILTGKTPN